MTKNEKKEKEKKSTQHKRGIDKKERGSSFTHAKE